MPIYEYKCSNCPHSDDLFLKLSEAITKNCPECSRETFEKMLSALAFKLNGSGWYETDFRKPVKKTETNPTTFKDLVKTDSKKNV